MNPLSRYEVEQICETVYYQALEMMSRYDYVDSNYEFQNHVEQDFKDWAYPKFNWKIQESDKAIVYKWQQKVRCAAREWYENNVERRKEEERREREYKKQLEDEKERLQEEEEEERKREEKRRKKELEEAEALRRYEAEETARLEAEKIEAEKIRIEKEAKRKDQEIKNRIQLEQLQAQWKEKRDSKSKTQSQPMETKNKMSNTLTCPQCGEEVSPTAKFCTSCGTKLLVVCENCGTSLKSTAKFCTSCGTPLQGDKPVTKKEPSPLNKENIKIGNYLMNEIREKGGIILFGEDDQDFVEDQFIIELLPHLKREEEIHKEWVDKVIEDIESDETEWKIFGEPALNEKKYGVFLEDYENNIEYTILYDDTLILRGDGETFALPSQEEQDGSEKNYWVVNTEIQKIKSKIKNLIILGNEIVIGTRLFKGFRNLEKVFMTGVKTIQSEAFYECGIKFLIVDEDLRTIFKNAFVNAKFEYLILPIYDNFFGKVYNEAFVNCKELKYAICSDILSESYNIAEIFKGCDKLNVKNIWKIEDIKNK